MHRTALKDSPVRPIARDRSMASILCPVDFSDESLATLCRAAAIASRSRARLAALHVADPLLVRAAAGAYHMDIVVGESRRALEDALEQVRGAAAPAEIEVGAHVVVGDPAHEISKFCAAHDVDLIVMASHQLTGYRRLLFGSVTDGVLRGTSAPVLVFPPHPSERASTLCLTLRLDDAPAAQV
jgi:nucleotide-binding universal stress UspA family protein